MQLYPCRINEKKKKNKQQKTPNNYQGKSVIKTHKSYTDTHTQMIPISFDAHALTKRTSQTTYKSPKHARNGTTNGETHHPEIKKHSQSRNNIFLLVPS